MVLERLCYRKDCVVRGCSDRIDPFFIEKGRPAQREAGGRETSGGVVHVISTKKKLRTRVAC